MAIKSDSKVAVRVPPTVRAADQREETAAKSFLNAVDVVETVRGLSDVQVYLGRRPEGGGEWKHLGIWPGEEFDIEAVRVKWGGGHYRMQTRGALESGKRGWIEGGSAVFDIEGPPIPVGGIVGAPVAPERAESSGNELLWRTMVDQANKRADDNRDLMLKMLDRQAAPTPGGGIGEIIAAVKDVMAMGQAVDPRQHMKDMTDAMAEGIKAGQDMKGSGNRKTEWADVVKDALPAIREVASAMTLTAQAGRRPGPPPRPPVPSLGNPAQSVGNVPPAPGTETAEAVVDGPSPPVDRANVPPWLLQVEDKLPLLVAMANASMDPAATAEQILNKLDDDTVGALTADCRVDGWVDRTLGILPAPLSQAHVGWTTAVLDAIREIVTAPADEEPEPQGG